jgi:acetyltransferase
VAVPIASVPEVIRQCAAARIGGAIVISAGGKETGSKGRLLEASLREDTLHSGLRIVGPNCLGIISSQARLNASFANRMPMPGSMAFISQSGAICTVVLDLSLKARIGFSHFISLGSMMDVDFGDVIDYLGGDPKVKSIVMYVENLTRQRNFMSAARAVARIKPIVVLKAGRTPAGARAAASHTGAMAGQDDVYDAAFNRAGIVRVKTFEELFDCAELLAKQPRPAGPHLAIITNAGGLGVMAADALNDYGLEPAALSPATLARLDAVLSSSWSRQNPIDMIGDSSTPEYKKVMEICMQAPEIDGLLVMLAPQALISPNDVAQALVEFLKGKSFPVITSWMGGPTVEKGREILNSAGIPTFDTAERAVRAFMDLYRHSQNLALLQEIPARLPRKLSFDPPAAQQLIRQSPNLSDKMLNEIESKALLQAYGIPVNRTEIARSAEEAAGLAAAIGFPVAMKIQSAAISHKTDAGGVALHLDNAGEVRRAFDTIVARCRQHAPGAVVEGVAVQSMIDRADYEVILGARQDPQFGPVLLFGMGGIMTNVFQDRALALPPLNRLLARRLMEKTKIYQLLQGYRNRPPADIQLLEEILIRLSQLVTDWAEIAELDINPLLIKDGAAVAVDARVLLHSPAATSPHHLVISPYPAQYESFISIDGVGQLQVRPIKPDDAVLLEALFAELSPRSVYYRFFSPLKALPRHMLARFTQIDYDREIAMVAILEAQDKEKMLGVARVILEWNQKDAEFAVLVGDPWQGRGIGAALLKRCLAVAKERGYTFIHGTVLAENTQMLRLGKKLNFHIHRISGANEYELKMNLAEVVLDSDQ